MRDRVINKVQVPLRTHATERQFGNTDEENLSSGSENRGSQSGSNTYSMNTGKFCTFFGLEFLMCKMEIIIFTSEVRCEDFKG